jgi:hypothetical protein
MISMTFDLAWTADPITEGRWELFGTNNTGGPVTNSFVAIYGRGMSYPPELADGASHRFLNTTNQNLRLAEGVIPSTETAVVGWYDSDDVFHQEPPPEPEE